MEFARVKEEVCSALGGRIESGGKSGDEIYNRIAGVHFNHDATCVCMMPHGACIMSAHVVA